MGAVVLDGVGGVGRVVLGLMHGCHWYSYLPYIHTTVFFLVVGVVAVVVARVFEYKKIVLLLCFDVIHRVLALTAMEVQ